VPTSYTSILKLALPATGELSGTWGDVVNNNITSMVEQAVAGLATINSWTTNSHTLTTANGTTSESRCAILVLDDDGLGQPSAAATVICPAASKIYIVRNICGQTATIKTAAGTGVAIPNNATTIVFCDGTNVLEGATYSGSVNIDGGTIDGTTIGATTPSTGAFTTLSSTGNTTLGDAAADTVTINGTPTINAPTVITTNSTSDALRITQTGTGNVLVVEDSASPDSSPFVIDADGRIVSGATSLYPAPVNPVFTDKFQINGANTYDSSADFISWSSGTDTAASINLVRSDSNTIGTHTVVGSADVFGNVRFFGSDGTKFIEGAKISAVADGTPGTNDMPCRLVFSTTADGASTPTERMRINNAGQVLIGNTTSTDASVNLLVSSATGSATPVPTEVRIQTTTNASDYSTTLPWGRLSFYNSDSSGGGPKIHAAIQTIATSTGSASILGFSTNNTTDDTLTERARFSTPNNASVPAVFSLSNNSGLSIARTSVTAPAGSDGNVFSGTYTPTLTNTTNVASSTAAVCQYMRVGNTVTVSGEVSITPTATGNTLLGFSLPVGSTLTAVRQVGGTAVAQTTAQVMSVYGDSTNNRATFRMQAAATTALTYAFSFTYRVL
jgi:hypothetical protein